MLHPQLNHQLSTPSPQISWNNLLGAWEVRSYPDVLAILKEKRFSAAGANIIHPEVALPGLGSDPKAAPQEVIRALHQELPWIHQKIQERISTACQNKSDLNPINFYDEIILPCCQQLAVELTDTTIKYEERQVLLQDAHAVFLMNSSENSVKAGEATNRLSTYFLNKIILARSSPKADYISVLAQTNAEPYELLSPIIQLFVGVATSLPLLLSNVLLALISNPDEKEKYLHQPSQSINELLRYAGPAHVVFRLAMEDLVIGTKTFKRGDRLALFLANANMDETQFSCPHQLNSDRNAAAHLSLGKGLHACLGAPIIRAAVTIVPKIILSHFPDITIDVDKVVWGGSLTIQGIVSLPGNEKEICNH